MKEWHQYHKISGIYVIRNKINTKLYIGSAAVSIKQRFHKHYSDLKYNRHHSAHLQASWNKYGSNSFEFLIVEECLPEDCLVLEQYYIDYYDACNPGCGYNSAPTAGSTLGFEFSDESKEKISKALKGKRKGIPHTPEHSAKIAAALKGKKKSPEHAAKTAAFHKGRKASAETRAKMSAARKGRKPSAACISATIESNKRRKGTRRKGR